MIVAVTAVGNHIRWHIVPVRIVPVVIAAMPACVHAITVLPAAVFWIDKSRETTECNSGTYKRDEKITSFFPHDVFVLK